MPGRTHFPRFLLLAAAVALLAAGLGAAPHAVDPDREMRIKAGMLLNFIKFTHWPEGGVAAGEDIDVLVVGEGDMVGVIDATLKGQRPGDRGLRVRHARLPKQPDEWEGFLADARRSHVIYFCDAERERVGRALDGLGDAPTLTVSDARGFAARGGMMGLNVAKDRVVFDANPGRIRATGLRVSSQVLRLATTVETKEP